MFDELTVKVHAFFKWVYNWITVLAGVIVGALAFAPDALNAAFSLYDSVAMVDLTPFGISAITAAKITSGVALAKGLLSWWQSRRATA